jgi:hypothetical protein
MITNDWVQGYLTALKTVETAVDHLGQDVSPNYRRMTDDKNLINGVPEDSMIMLRAIRQDLLDFLKEQRSSYKQLVDKLNKENSNG